LGFKPQDSAEPFRMAREQSPALDAADPARIYQGGGFVKKGPFE
jgi:uronate dehydrogenase